MNKTIIAICMLIAAGGFADDEAFKNQVRGLRGDQAAALAMLSSATNQAQTNVCYYTAIASTPMGERLALVDTIPAGAVQPVQLERFMIYATPKGAVCNALLVTMYGNSSESASYIRKFDPAAATKEECVLFYELVLKNIELNEMTKPHLERIKGNLLKLKDL